MPTGILTGTGNFFANATAPEVYPTTGFVTGYIWSSLDNATWCAFLMYQLYYSFVILNEAALNYKQTFIWALVFFAIACNMMASISGFFLLDCFTFNLTPDPHICDGQMHAYYALEGMCYCLGFWLLFYRKYKVVPDKIGYTGAIDTDVLAACCSLNLEKKNVRCFYSDINTCFLQDVFQASAGALSFLYFDLWFLVCVMRKTFEGGSKWEVLQLCALTGSMTFLVGSISYKTWGVLYSPSTLNMNNTLSPAFISSMATCTVKSLAPVSLTMAWTHAGRSEWQFLSLLSAGLQKRSEFSHPDIVIILTALSFFRVGLTNEQVKAAIGFLLTLG
ncbi:hypothetical protein HDU78_004024 [Chytriomyces hyalinus]|nr:hypothetical protein HDU78_004024 [Chytriomyces hyalinus]